MRSIVLVDNNPLAMIACPDNAIPIASYFDQPRYGGCLLYCCNRNIVINSQNTCRDRELEAMAKLLNELRLFSDVRPYLVKRFEFRAVVSDHFRFKSSPPQEAHRRKQEKKKKKKRRHNKHKHNK